jgi:NUMOD3 motif
MPVLHKHHIVPRYMGGDDLPDNLTPPISVQLHAALHKDLYDELGHIEDLIAWRMLLGLSLSGFEFNELIRTRLSGSHKGKPNNQLGLKRSKESREKMRLAHLGKKLSKQHADAISNSLLGNQRRLGTFQSKQTRLKISESNKLAYAEGRR